MSSFLFLAVMVFYGFIIQKSQKPSYRKGIILENTPFVKMYGSFLDGCIKAVKVRLGICNALARNDGCFCMGDITVYARLGDRHSFHQGKNMGNPLSKKCIKPIDIDTKSTIIEIIFFASVLPRS